MFKNYILGFRLKWWDKEGHKDTTPSVSCCPQQWPRAIAETRCHQQNIPFMSYIRLRDTNAFGVVRKDSTGYNWQRMRDS